MCGVCCYMIYIKKNNGNDHCKWENQFCQVKMVKKKGSICVDWFYHENKTTKNTHTDKHNHNNNNNRLFFLSVILKWSFGIVRKTTLNEFKIFFLNKIKHHHHHHHVWFIIVQTKHCLKLRHQNRNQTLPLYNQKHSIRDKKKNNSQVMSEKVFFLVLLENKN